MVVCVRGGVGRFFGILKDEWELTRQLHWGSISMYKGTKA